MVLTLGFVLLQYLDTSDYYYVGHVNFTVLICPHQLWMFSQISTSNLYSSFSIAPIPMAAWLVGCLPQVYAWLEVNPTLDFRLLSNILGLMKELATNSFHLKQCACFCHWLQSFLSHSLSKWYLQENCCHKWDIFRCFQDIQGADMTNRQYTMAETTDVPVCKECKS